MQNSGHEEGKEFGGEADESAFWNSRSAEDETPSSHDKTVSPPHRRSAAINGVSHDDPFPSPLII